MEGVMMALQSGSTHDGCSGATNPPAQGPTIVGPGQPLPALERRLPTGRPPLKGRRPPAGG